MNGAYGGWAESVAQAANARAAGAAGVGTGTWGPGGGVPGYGVGGRTPLPRGLLWVQVLQWVQIALSTLYVLTVLSMMTYYNGELFGTLLYDCLPSILGIWLARRAWHGGARTRRGLIIVQGWLLWLSFVSLLHLDYRGLTQAAIPIAVIVLLRRPDVREWFELEPEDRERPRGFRIERMILWRRDQGQTAMEYLGLILVVVAVIGAMVATGIGSDLSHRIGAQVCRIGGGGDCGGSGDGGGSGGSGGSGGDDVEAGDPAESGGATGGSGGTGGSGSSGGTGSGGTQTSTADIVTMSENDTIPVAPGPLEREVDNDDFKEDPDEPLIPEERNDRTLWDHTRGFFVAPFTGLINDTYAVATNPKKVVTDTVEGIRTYTKDWWKKEGGGVSEKWKKGNYLGAGWEAADKGEDFVIDFAVDMFVDKENWKKGNKGASIGNTALGIVGIFTPKSIKKLTRMGDVGKKRNFPNTRVGKAAEAAEKTREYLKRNEPGNAKKFADEAQKHADEAAEKARKDQKKQCANLAMASGRMNTAAAHSQEPTGPTTATYAVFHDTGAPTTLPAAFRTDNSCGPDDDDVKEERAAQQEALNAREALLKDALREAKKQQKPDKVNVQDAQVDQFLSRAKDRELWDSKDYTKKDAADALDDLNSLVRDKRVDGQSREMLTAKVLSATNKDKLAEALAEVNTVRRVAENEAADGTRVYSAVGEDAGKTPDRKGKLPDGKGGEIDVSGIPDADVAYRGKDGKVHVVEVKNRGQATKQYSFPAQVKRLGEWQKEQPGRQARYEIESTDKWHQIFEQFNTKPQSKTEKRQNAPKVRHEGNPALEMAKNDVGVRIAGQDVSPSQLKRMEAAWNSKSDTEKYEAIHTGKMKDPKTAMEYLGVS